MHTRMIMMQIRWFRATVHVFTSIYLFQSIIVMGAHQTLHGDGVKDIAFSVEDCRALYKVRRLLTQAI